MSDKPITIIHNILNRYIHSGKGNQINCYYRSGRDQHFNGYNLYFSLTIS